MALRRVICTVSLSIISSFIPSAATKAANRFWITSGGGAFGVPAAVSPNWSTMNGGPGGATVPSTTDTATFSLNAVYTVTFAQNVTNDTLDIDNGSVTFSLGGNTYTVTATGQSVRIGDVAGQTGRFTISNGTLQADDTFVGATSGTAVGTLTINGGVWNDTQMIVGDLGNGTLTIQNGGDVNESLDATIGDDLSGVGTATVFGGGTTWNVSRFLNVGASGSGSLDIFSGGAVTGQTVRLGAIAGGTGNAIVRGA
jgi:T5SS/PEP-CTERM-associated repeat protein